MDVVFYFKKSFFIYWDGVFAHMVFFNLLICCVTLIDLWVLKNACILGAILLDHGVWVLLMCCWNRFACILWSLCLCLLVILWPIIFSFCDILDFGIRGICGLIKRSLEVFPSPPQFLWNSFRKIVLTYIVFDRILL